MEQEQKPRVGVGVMVLKQRKVLLGRRKSSHGAGEYAFPGGHLEYFESFADCARRETREECGVEIDNIRFIFVLNDKTYLPKHYVHIGLAVDWKSGEPQVLEPEKCEGWAWCDLGNLPEPLFKFCKISIDSLRTGRNYYDL